MKNLWICTTRIFLFQILVGGVTFGMTGDVALAATAVIIMTAAAVIVTALSAISTTATYADLLTTLAALIAAFAAHAALIAAFAFIELAAFVIAALVFVIAKNARENGAKEPFWALWLTALPAGVGTIIGGSYLLALRLQGRRTTTS